MSSNDIKNNELILPEKPEFTMDYGIIKDLNTQTCARCRKWYTFIL